MKTIILAVLALLISASAWAKPRLLIVISVDQMRADYFDRSFSQGLKQLQKEGAFFTNARHDHIPTETGPGHAAILTGTRPGRSGIVGNTWWDRSSSTEVYVVEDSVHGLGPEHLLTYTVGDALKASDPESKVVSVSAKDRAAILMGGKKADAAVWYSRKNGVFTTTSYYPKLPWLDAFNETVKRKDGPLGSMTPDDYDGFVYFSSADAAVLLLAEEAIDRFKLGRDEHPDILAVGFSATDYIGHKWGFEDEHMGDHLKKLDGFVAELIKAGESSAGKGNVDVVLTADHGVTPLPEGRLGKKEHIKRVLWDDLETELERAAQYSYPSAKKWIINQYPNIYVSTENVRVTGLGWYATLRVIAKSLEAAPDVAKAYVAGEIDRGDPYAQVYERSILPGRSGDIVIRVKEGVLVTDRAKGTDHGAPYENDFHVPLIFWGPDFKEGKHKEITPVVDLAPTLAQLLGVKLPSAEGKPHPEILR